MGDALRGLSCHVQPGSMHPGCCIMLLRMGLSKQPCAFSLPLGRGRGRRPDAPAAHRIRRPLQPTAQAPRPALSKPLQVHVRLGGWEGGQARQAQRHGLDEKRCTHTGRQRLCRSSSPPTKCPSRRSGVQWTLLERSSRTDRRRRKAIILKRIGSVTCRFPDRW